jgi:hypothetical protein
LKSLQEKQHISHFEQEQTEITETQTFVRYLRLLLFIVLFGGDSNITGGGYVDRFRLSGVFSFFS